ncbi:MAG: hypothetical protein IJ680_03085, partial [Paludibacteraceae bacterium]|nr:hypothetical protein [Paludibacteraceae bacterium]
MSEPDELLIGTTGRFSPAYIPAYTILEFFIRPCFSGIRIFLFLLFARQQESGMDFICGV